MARLIETVSNQFGDVIPGATVLVRSLGGVLLQTLTTDADGMFYLTAPAGEYNLEISGPGITTKNINGIILVDASPGLPSSVSGDVGKVLTATSTANTPAWSAIPTEVPDNTVADAGKVLSAGVTANSRQWVTPYTHPTGDGNLHVPATGTTNNGKVLTAGATAGDIKWTDLPAASTYTHPTGDGNLHVPATGTTNNGKVLTAGANPGELKWTDLPVGSAPVIPLFNATDTYVIGDLVRYGDALYRANGAIAAGAWNAANWTKITHTKAELDAAYATASHTHSFADITSKPTTLAGYGITDAAAATHTHNYAGSDSAGGAANSVKNTNIIKFDTGTTEDVDLYTFDGSTAKTVNIKAGTGVKFTKAANSITIAADASFVAPSYTVATLPAGQTAGTVALATDTIGRVLSGAVTGGGSVRMLVVFDGTNWVQA